MAVAGLLEAGPIGSGAAGEEWSSVSWGRSRIRIRMGLESKQLSSRTVVETIDKLDASASRAQLSFSTKAERRVSINRSGISLAASVCVSRLLR